MNGQPNNNFMLYSITYILITVLTAIAFSSIWEFFIDIKIYRIIFGESLEHLSHFERMETIFLVSSISLLSVLYPYHRICSLLKSSVKGAQKHEVLAKEAAIANEAKSQFLAHMSHELRTPLNAIIGFSDIIKLEVYGSVGNAHYKGYIEDISNSGTQLLSLVNDILDLSKLESGEYTLNEETWSPLDLSNGVIKTFEHITRNKALFIKTSASHRMPPTILADKRVITQILNNLLANACRHTAEGGEITVAWDFTHQGEISLHVRDTGEGISKEIIEKLDKPFAKQDAHKARTGGEGIGLGLYICRLLMERSGGELHIESDVGVGTTVTALWPRERLLSMVA